MKKKNVIKNLILLTPLAALVIVSTLTLSANDGELTAENTEYSEEYNEINDEELTAEDTEYSEEYNEVNDVELVTEENSVISVSFPQEISFKIDPFEINGRGSVYSDDFKIYNNSDEAVVVTISSIQYIFGGDGNYTSLGSEDELEYLTDEKAIFLYLNTGNPEEDTVITDYEQVFVKHYYLESPYLMSEEGENETSFSISGAVSKGVEWVDGDVQIIINYIVTPASEFDLSLFDDYEYQRPVNTAAIIEPQPGPAPDLGGKDKDPNNPGEIDPNNPGEIDPNNPGEIDPNNPGEIDPNNPGEIDPNNPGEIDPNNPGETDPDGPGETDSDGPGEADPDNSGEA